MSGFLNANDAIGQALFESALEIGGANLAVSSLVYTYLLAPIPVEEPDQLVRVLTSTPAGQTSRAVSYPNYADGRAQAASIDLAAHAQSAAQIGSGDADEDTEEIGQIAH